MNVYCVKKRGVVVFYGLIKYRYMTSAFTF